MAAMVIQSQLAWNMRNIHNVNHVKRVWKLWDFVLLCSLLGNRCEASEKSDLRMGS